MSELGIEPLVELEFELVEGEIVMGGSIVDLDDVELEIGRQLQFLEDDEEYVVLVITQGDHLDLIADGEIGGPDD